ncbi:MAG: single-stranded-DNA-specific exonuclease RecJ [Rubrimonas sp.]|uniref:single-stranded-DNA-specific exonuclease RecJ n=1 Tax=Rubrimonas sp. TaxID=2036015 RepID=UPI002FDCE997
MLDAHALLNVACSVTGRRWVGPDAATERAGLAVAQATGAPEVLGRVLARQGVRPDAARAYLAPSLRELMPDPSRLRDMDVAADRLAGAVARGARIAIFGDYDVDGAASAALVGRWLRAQGNAATIYIPDRIDEGYGPNIPAMQTLARAHDLILCVDCGARSDAPIAAARALGAEVLVADHHLCAETPPQAEAVVNPNRHDDESGLGNLCAAGVCFLLVVAANRVLRARGMAAPDPLPLLELVALATVADVAPLTGLNRAFVRQGLKVMAQRRTPGLRALADAARLSGPPDAFHLGFVLGPRINAGGRIGRADLGARLLMCDDPDEAAALAARLEELNEERRGVEAAVQAQALAQVEARGAEGPLVWAAGEGWHPGVVGIVASRLKERYDRPAVVIGLCGAEGKGSGRSTAGVDLGRAVERLAAEGLLLRGGGHPMAAGLSVAAEAVAPAMARLGALLAGQGAGPAGPRDLRLDGALALGGATLELCALLDAAGPWGQGAPAPRFAFPSVRLRFAKPAGERHLRLTLGDGPDRLDAVAFGAMEGPLGEFLLSRAGAPVHVAGRLEIDSWGGGRRAKLRLDDAAPV